MITHVFRSSMYHHKHVNTSAGLEIIIAYVIVMEKRQLLYSKTATLKKTKNCFQDQSSLNAGQKYCKMLQREHSAILSTFVKLPVVIKIFVLSIFEWPFYTSFTVYANIKG